MANKIWMDSGAFSAFTKGVPTNLNTYCSWLHKHGHFIDHYAVLDAIGDARATWDNQVEMERQGTSPVPCFHYGEDPKWLIKYLDKYEYIALGGMVPISTKDLYPWLDDLWGNYLTNCDGVPRVRVHGFGLTTFPLMARYPWFSVDSSSWLQTGMFGGVVFWDHHGKLHAIDISDRSPKTADKGQHYATETPANQAAIRVALERSGFKLEELMASYKFRHVANLKAYMDYGSRVWELRPYVARQMDLFSSAFHHGDGKVAGLYPWRELEMYFAGQVGGWEVEHQVHAAGANRMFSYHYIGHKRDTASRQWMAWCAARDGSEFKELK